MWKRFNRYNSGKLLSAQDIVYELDRLGVCREKINGAHLASIYRRLKRLSSAPDFTGSRDLLSSELTYIADQNCPVLGVIVETRRHPALEFVVSCFEKRLHIPIQLFHGRRNLEFIMLSSISELVHRGKVHLVQLDADELDASRYNALFMTERFWRRLISKDKILVFQTDAIICSGSDYKLTDFLSFDYIGSKWSRERPVGLLIDGGNGGLSLRDWNKSYECLSRFPAKKWTGGEDGYFAFHIDLIGGKVGGDSDCARFSTQHEFLYKSLGAHRISCLDQSSRAAFLQYCDDARFMTED